MASKCVEREVLPWTERWGWRLLSLSGLLVVWLPTGWSAANHVWRTSEYAYAPLLLALGVALLWYRMRFLLWVPTRAGLIGAGWLLALGVPLYVLGRSQQIELVEQLACLLWLAAAITGLGGWSALRSLRFPVGFFLFALPYPGWVIDGLTRPLKLWISQGAEWLLYGLGYPIARSGVVLSLGPYRLLVADACTGLHSLIFLTAMGLLYIHLSGPRRDWHRALLVLALFPLALVANFVRVVVLLWVTYHWGDAVGQAFWHDVAGLGLYVCAFVGLLVWDGVLARVGWCLTMPMDVAGTTKRHSLPLPVQRTRARLWGRSVGLMALALITAGGAIAWVPQQVLAHHKPVVTLAELVPMQLGSWRVDEQDGVLRVAADLQANVQRLYAQTLSRTYVNPQGERIMLSIAYGSRQLGNELQAHRPEYCYQAQGFALLESSDGVLPLPGQNLPVRRLVAVQHTRMEPITYWMTVGNLTALPGLRRKWAQLRYGLRGEVPDGLLVRVSSVSRNSGSAFDLHARFVADLQQALPGQLGLMPVGAAQP